MCNSDVYKEEAGRTIKKPDLGYFILKETKEYQNLVKKFLQNGYMILNETNAKIYGDSLVGQVFIWKIIITGCQDACI